MATQRNIAIDFAALILGGLLYTLSFPPYSWASAGWIALAPLFLVIRNRGFAGGALCGMIYGVAICTGVAGWLYPAIASYFAVQSALGLLLTAAAFAVFVGIYTGLAAGTTALIMRRCPPIASWLAAPALWVVAEYARSSLFSGFSWGLLGYSQGSHPLTIQIADLTGIYGVSFLLALTAYAIADVIGAGKQATSWLEVGGATLGIVLALGYGAIRLRDYPLNQEASGVRITLVRHDMPAAERWQRVFYTQAFLRYLAATQARVPRDSADLVVWPEFASGFYLDRDPPIRMLLARLLAQTRASLLVGGPRIGSNDGATRIYNSAYLFAPDGKLLDTYDKLRLLPFAEAHSSVLPPPGPRDADYTSQFSPGSRATIFALPNGSHFGVMICFEATYPEFARALTRGGAGLLVNISNDVWLTGAGGMAAAEQHLAMAAIRAVENRRPLARATMGGINGFVDPAGRLYDLSQAPDSVSFAQVEPRTEITLYTRFGDWFVALCAAFSLVCLVYALSWRKIISR